MNQSAKTAILAAIAGTLLSASAFAGGIGELTTTRGSGNLVTREFDFSDFTALEVGYSFVVTVRQNSEYRVSVTTDDNIMESLRPEQRGYQLRIGLARGTRVDPTTVEVVTHLGEKRTVDRSGRTL